MDNKKFAWCNTCEDLVTFTHKNEEVIEEFHGKTIKYEFDICRCSICGSEVAGDIGYNYRKSDAKWNSYNCQN